MSSDGAPGTLSKPSERRISELEHFKEEHGHLNIPRHGETRSLYSWLYGKKKARDVFLIGGKGTDGTAITLEEINKLDELGVDWTVSEQGSSESRLADLARFKDEHGHLNVPQHGQHKEMSLYKWLYGRKTQRDDFLAGKKVSLTQVEFDHLNELGVDWSIGGKTGGSQFTDDSRSKRRTGYTVFVQLRTEEMRATRTDLSPPEVKELVLSEWREMNDDEKEAWKVKARAEAGG